MKIGILVYSKCSLWSASGPMELLIRANKAKDYFYENRASSLKFDVEFVGGDRNKVETGYNYPISYNTDIYSGKIYDLIVVPGFDHDLEETLILNKDAIEWIKFQHLNKSKIASICTGSFLLAKSGILNGRTATTHWLGVEKFEKLFPDVRLTPEKILIDNGDFLISGGATSFHNLIIYIIEKYMGRKVALGVSKLYLIGNHLETQKTFSVLTMQKEHKDKEIIKAQTYIESNFRIGISLQQLADKLCMSKRNFIRRFKKATGDTPFLYIQKVKVEEAKKMLESENRTVEEIVYEVGYEDTNAFRKLFVKHTGTSPGKYKKMFNTNCFN